MMANIIKNNGRFNILQIAAGDLTVIEKAGRTCYKSEKGEITKETAKVFTKKLLHLFRHESVIEHSLITVKFSNVSRGFTHELVRHRLAAFSQESTRYVDYVKDDLAGSCDVNLDRFRMGFVVPPNHDENEKVALDNGLAFSIVEMANLIEMFYRALRKNGWAPEDARQVLPTGLTAEIVVSANFREWRHIFKMRLAKEAHWEIRAVMGDLLVHLKKLIPIIFDDFVEIGVCKKGVRYFGQIEIAKGKE